MKLVQLKIIMQLAKGMFSGTFEDNISHCV